jgi:hypothetical protein
MRVVAANMLEAIYLLLGVSISSRFACTALPFVLSLAGLLDGRLSVAPDTVAYR